MRSVDRGLNRPGGVPTAVRGPGQQGGRGALGESTPRRSLNPYSKPGPSCRWSHSDRPPPAPRAFHLVLNWREKRAERGASRRGTHCVDSCVRRLDAHHGFTGRAQDPA